jgi:hypothetical protein
MAETVKYCAIEFRVTTLGLVEEKKKTFIIFLTFCYSAESVDFGRRAAVSP